MKWILLISIITFSGVVHSQSLVDYSNIMNLNEVLEPGQMIKRERKGGAAYGIKGSPNVYEDFVPGIIYFSKKVKSGTQMMNYNCFTNTVFLENGAETVQISSKVIDYLEFKPDENTSQIFRQVFMEDQQMSQFLQILYNEKSILYKRHYRDFMEADYSGAFSSEQRYDEYKNRYDYYISLNGSDLQLFKPKKKQILEIMENKSDDIEKFMKSSKIDLKSEIDLANLVKYYDSLSDQSQ
jgi:hypothetical protein